MARRPELWLAFAAVAALAGCRTAPYVNAHVESLNAEYRQLEDYVYCLEDENERLQQEIDGLRGARVKPSDSASGGGLFRRAPRTEGQGPSNPTPKVGPVEALDPPMIELPGAPSNTPPKSIMNKPTVDGLGESLDLAPPVIELPVPLSPKETGLPVPEALPKRPADDKITHISLNGLLTGGTDLDGRPGDDGLSVVIEPRNAGDEYVPDAGAVSVVVLDPSKEGDAARIARWDFDLLAARQKLQATGAARGIRLQMPWPATPPTSSPLQLFVRYETADGRKLQTDREIYLAPGGEQSSQRWTPRPPERQRPVAVPHTLPNAEVAQSPAATATATPTIKSTLPAGGAPAPQLLAPPPALSGSEKKAPLPTWTPFR